jgi:hypothetical protein
MGHDLDGARMNFWKAIIALDKSLNFLYPSLIVSSCWFIWYPSLNFWGIDEKGFPEGPNRKAPRAFA